MSEVLVFNTETPEIKQETIEPLPLYGEGYYMLDTAIPEFVGTLPNPVMSKLISRMKMTMKKFGGIGLSANQCGVLERVFVIGTDNEHIVCINPKVTNQSDKLIREDEGCLSFPGFFLKIDRPEWIDVEYLDENGRLQQNKFSGVTARCFLHELDHMNGVVFTKHVGPVSLQMARKRQKKMTKQVQKMMKNRG